MTRLLQAVLRIAFVMSVVFALGFGTSQALDLTIPRAADCPPCENDDDCLPLECCENGLGGMCHVPSGTCICN